MHSALHTVLAEELTRERVEGSGHGRARATRSPFAAIRARVARARDGAAPAIPPRAAPGV